MRAALGSMMVASRGCTAGGLFLEPLPEMAIAVIMTADKPAITQVCAFFGKMPGGFETWLRNQAPRPTFSGLGATSGIAVTSPVAADKAREGQLLFADSQIPVVEYLGNDVCSIMKFELNQVRLAIFH